MADSTEKKPNDVEILETNIEKNSSPVKLECTVTFTDKQQTWQVAFDSAHQNDPHPSEVEGMQAVESFGIDFGDGTLLTRNGIEKQEFSKTSAPLLVPKDGQKLTLNQLLHEYKTPFIDAYKRSKELSVNSPGKSNTLEILVDRLKACPWSSEISFVFDSKIDNPEYDNAHNRVTIKPQDPPERQIENFVHEAFHASNQFLSRLYDNGIVSRKDFVDTFILGEAQAMRAEVSVHKELKHKSNPPKFAFIDSSGKHQYLDIGKHIQHFGIDGLMKSIRSVRPAGVNTISYEKHYDSYYDNYVKYFAGNKSLVDLT